MRQLTLAESILQNPFISRALSKSEHFLPSEKNRSSSPVLDHNSSIGHISAEDFNNATFGLSSTGHVKQNGTPSEDRIADYLAVHKEGMDRVLRQDIKAQVHYHSFTENLVRLRLLATGSGTYPPSVQQSRTALHSARRPTKGKNPGPPFRIGRVAARRSVPFPRSRMRDVSIYNSTERVQYVVCNEPTTQR